MRWFLPIFLLGCSHNFLTHPELYGTKLMRDQWAQAKINGDLECSRLSGGKICAADLKTHSCFCLGEAFDACERMALR